MPNMFKYLFGFLTYLAVASSPAPALPAKHAPAGGSNFVSTDELNLIGRYQSRVDIIDAELRDMYAQWPAPDQHHALVLTCPMVS